jgi:hypothetical protein
MPHDLITISADTAPAIGWHESVANQPGFDLTLGMMQRPALQVVVAGLVIRPGDCAFDLRVGLAEHHLDRSLWVICRHSPAPFVQPSSHIWRSSRAISWLIAAARALICSADGVEPAPWIIPWRMNRRCLAVGPYPVSMWRKAEWHHHPVAAVDTGLTAARARRPIRDILPPV